MPQATRDVLETIAFQVGGGLLRLRTASELQENQDLFAIPDLLYNELGILIIVKLYRLDYVNGVDVKGIKKSFQFSGYQVAKLRCT